MSLIVPVSPPTKRTYDAHGGRSNAGSSASKTQRWAASSRSTSGPHPSRQAGPSTVGASFLSGSARANRKAVQSYADTGRADASTAVYKRSSTAQFTTKATAEAATTEPKSTPGRSTHSSYHTNEERLTDLKRTMAASIVERIATGPRQVAPPEDDPHFVRFEPYSGVALRKRFTSHAELTCHIEQRKIVPISTLYQIKLDGKSDDGDFTVPIDGDWLLMGVLTELRTVCFRDERVIGLDGNPMDAQAFKIECDEYVQRNGKEALNSDAEDNPYKKVLKVLPKQSYMNLKMVDMGQPLIRNETPGDAVVELTLFQAEESHLGHDGKRVYKGGSGGFYETFEKLGVGTLVCLLNPLLKKRRPDRSADGPRASRENLGDDPVAFEAKLRASQYGKNARKDAKEDSDKQGLLRLEPRRGDSVLAVGLAEHFDTCGVSCRSGGRCPNFVDLRSGLKVCEFHTSTQVARYGKGRQEFANGTSFFKRPSASAFGMSDGMSIGAKPRLFVSKSNERPTDTQAERERKEISKERAEKEREWRLKSNLRKSLSDKGDVADRPLLKPPPSARQSKGSGPAASTLESLAILKRNHSNSGMDAVESAIKKLKRRDDHGSSPAGLPLTSSASALQASSRPSRKAFDPSAPALSQSKSDSLPLTAASSKLLARHLVTTSSLPKPMMNVKRAKVTASVRPPPGASFYADDISDDELDFIVQQGALDDQIDQPLNASAVTDDDSDIEILP